jgi:VWFA-related protein
MRNLAALFAILLAVPAGLSQQPRPPAPLTETIEVDLINVDVTVVDRAGNRVQGLRPQDFRVYEAGRLQEITNFAEYGEEPAATADSLRTEPGAEPVAPKSKRQPLRLVFFVDNSSLHLASRARVFSEVRKFLRDTLRPEDEVSIVTWDRAVRTVLPFSNDPKVIADAVDAAADRSPSGSQEDAANHDLQQRSQFRNSADATSKSMRSAGARAEEAALDRRILSEDKYMRLRNTYAAFRAVLTKVAGVEGKKAVVLVTEGFESNALGISGSGPPDPQYDTTHFMNQAVDVANARGITLYAIHAAGVEPPLGSSVESGDIPEISVGEEQLKLTNSTISLGQMSKASGGLLSMSPASLGSYFERVRADLGTYYSLAYMNRSGKLDVERKLRIETVNPEYTVRSRNSVVARSEETKLTEQLMASLFYATEKNDMNVSIVQGSAKRVGRNRYLVPIELRFPMAAITFIPQGGQHSGGFSVLITASDDAEHSTEVTKKAQRVVIPAGKFDAARRELCVYTVDVKTRGVGGALAVAVRDEVSGATSIRKVDLPVIR